MKKNLLLGTLAALGMVLAAACSQEQLAPTQDGDEALVSFTIGLENSVQTRAISDGGTADQLTYALYDGTGKLVTTFGADDEDGVDGQTTISTEFPTTVTLSLAKGQTYKVAFWAQSSKCDAYTVVAAETAMNVTVDYTSTEDVTYYNNDETRDAFYAVTEPFTVSGSTAKDVELTRPFAQINVGVTDDDWNGAVASGVTITTSAVTINNAGNSIDLLTGAVTGTESVSYVAAAIPSDPVTLSTDADGDGTAEEYKWLSMSYILVNDGTTTADSSTPGANKTTLESLSYTFETENGAKTVDFSDGLTSVPVQRNYRTNIVGQILTGTVTFNIKIDPIYEDDYIYPDTVEEQLKMVAAYGGSITLEEDVALTTRLVIAEGVSVELNLNGKTITPAEGEDRVIQVNEGAELVINGDGTVGSLDSGALAVCVNGGTLIINGGTYLAGSQCSCIYLFKYIDGYIEINDGYFAVNEPANYGKEWYYVLNVQNGATGTISVKGGTFENYDPAQGDDTGTPATFVADGYMSVQSSTEPEPNGTYIVVAYQASAESADELTAAIEDEYISEITLDADVTTGAMDITTSKSIDLNGNTLTTTNDYVAYDGATLTIENGTITQENGGSLVCEAGAEIVLDNVSYSGGGWSCIFSDKNAEDTNISISNSTINGGYYAVSTNATTNPVGTSIITLENSTFVADETALLVNTPSEVTAKDCSFQGGWQAAFIRGGSAAFENCSFNLVLDAEYNDANNIPENCHNASGYWKSGNQAETAALLIGNKCATGSTSYNYPTSVSLTNCTFSVGGTISTYYGEKTLADFPSVYIWSRVEDGNGTSISYDATSYNNFTAAYVANDGENLTVNSVAYEGGSTLPAVE